FRASWLPRVYPSLGTPEQVRDHLHTLSAVDLIRLATPEPELDYLFKHSVTQEGAYESMAITTQASLHDGVGGGIEQAYGDSIDLHVDVLAFHYGRSRNTEKQRHYFRRAGDAARAAYANQVAIDYYQRLLSLLSPAEQPDVLCHLGQVWQLIGQWA